MSVPLRTVFRLLPALLAPCLAAGANQYAIDVQADGNLNVRGTARLSWRNDTPGPVSEVPLRCSGSIGRVTVGGKALHVQEGRVRLPEPVAAGAATTLDIEFEAHARGVFGYRLLSGPWHPKALTFRDGRFNPDQQQSDEYEVTVLAPASLVVAAAGESLDAPPAPAGLRRLHWRMPHAASFGLAASPNFEETRRSSEGVEIRFYQLRGGAQLDPVMVDYAVDVVAFCRQLFGFYPHPAVVMLPGSLRWGGGSSPASGFTQFFKNDGESVRWIVAHEIAHQYWGFDTVIDDGDYFHWPGLPLGIYTDQLYMAQRAKLRFGTGQYRASVSEGLDTTIRRTTQQMKANRFDWGEIVCHEKAYTVVRMLSDMMGPDRFLQFLRTLQDRYRYQFLSFDAFQAAAEAAAGRKLDWFSHDWVDTNGVAGYAIESVEAHGGSIQVRVRRTGTARFSVEVRLTTEDGAQSVQRIAPEPDTGTLDFAAAGQPRRVEIDPRGVCPLRKTGKEIWTML
jgi:hypothetical protein